MRSFSETANNKNNFTKKDKQNKRKKVEEPFLFV
jgi:hypothetical protein